MRRELKRGFTYFLAGGHALERRMDGKVLRHTPKGPVKDEEGRILYREDAFIDIDETIEKAQGHKFMPTEKQTQEAEVRNAEAAKKFDAERVAHNQAVAKEIAKNMDPEDLKILLGAAENKMASSEEVKAKPKAEPKATDCDASAFGKVEPKAEKPVCKECGGKKFGKDFAHKKGCSKKKVKT